MARLVGSSHNNSHNSRASINNHSRSTAVDLYACSGVVAVVVATADETSHAEARLAKPSQASQSREGLINGSGYFCDAKGLAKGLTTGCGTGYIKFVNGPVDRPRRGGDVHGPTWPFLRQSHALQGQEKLGQDQAAQKRVKTFLLGCSIPRPTPFKSAAVVA